MNDALIDLAMPGTVPPGRAGILQKVESINDLAPFGDATPGEVQNTFQKWLIVTRWIVENNPLFF